MSNPGYWPANARDVAMLVPDDTTLLPLGANFSRSGVNDGVQRGTTLDRFLNNPPLYPKATVSVSERMKGSRPLQGSFQLTFCNDTRAAPRAPRRPTCRFVADGVRLLGPDPARRVAAAFEAALEAMEHAGDVGSAAELLLHVVRHLRRPQDQPLGRRRLQRRRRGDARPGAAQLDADGGACEGDYRDAAGAGDCSA